MRHLIEDQRLQQWKVAEILGLTEKQIQRRIRRLGLTTQRTGPRGGAEHPEWKGGRHLDKNGYVLLYAPGHPSARGKYILEHRLVMEQHLGRHLTRDEVVHHRNGNREDNRIDNLEVFATNADHLRHELTGRCPKWTPEGKARILAACREGGRRTRLLRARDARAKPQTTRRSTANT
jgi:hypothetical protein